MEIGDVPHFFFESPWQPLPYMHVKSIVYLCRNTHNIIVIGVMNLMLVHSSESIYKFVCRNLVQSTRKWKNINCATKSTEIPGSFWCATSILNELIVTWKWWCDLSSASFPKRIFFFCKKCENSQIRFYTAQWYCSETLTPYDFILISEIDWWKYMFQGIFLYVVENKQALLNHSGINSGNNICRKCELLETI